MFPIKTIQGLPAEKLRLLVRERDIYIYGAGFVGEAVLTSVTKSGLTPKAFVDTRKKLIGTDINGCPIVSRDSVLNGSTNRDEIFLIVATSEYKDIAVSECVDSGLLSGEDFITYLSISRPVAAVDVAGMCKLECMSCPHGNMDDLLPAGYMDFDTYGKVLDKLILDIPLLTGIELFTWGEPLMNPDLPEIIKLTENYVPSIVSTNLMDSECLERVVKAEPSQLIVTVCGYQESYEKSMNGASWRGLMNNLKILEKLIKQYKVKTKVIIKAYSYLFVGANHQEVMIELSKRLGFSVVFGDTYLNPYDKLLNRCHGKDIGSTAKNVIIELPWDVDKVIELSKKDKDLACLPQRVFPVINWNLSVALCHVYYNPIISNNYLDISWDDLLCLRHKQEQCVKCQEAGLHRLDMEVLARRYPEEINDVYRIKTN